MGVTDTVVTMTECGYTSPVTTAGDFRRLTPLVVTTALQNAGTAVCEPINRFVVDAPADTLFAVLRLLARHRAVLRSPAVSGAWFTLDGQIPATEVPRLRQQLHGFTPGDGVLEVHFDRYEPRPDATQTRPAL